MAKNKHKKYKHTYSTYMFWKGKVGVCAICGGAGIKKPFEDVLFDTKSPSQSKHT